MSVVTGYGRYAVPIAIVVLLAWVTGCDNGSRSAQLLPMVMASTPANHATGVVGNPSITATFNQPMAPISGAAGFAVTCAAPCVSPTGAVALDAANTTATFQLTAGTTLAPLTLYTATVSAAMSLDAGRALQAPHVWTFTTAAAPTVTAVSPVNLATVATDTKTVSAAFDEALAPFAGAASFTLTCAAPCTSPTGTVTLDPTGRIAIFTLPAAAPLSPLTTYTATVSGAVSLATRLELTSPYAWQFTTGETPDITRPTVALTDPATTTPGPTPGVATNSAISAVFSEDMDPASIESKSAPSYTVTCASPCVSPTGTVSYVVGNRTALFTPAAPLTSGATYTATVTTAATDLAGNALEGNQGPPDAASNYVWTFTTAAAAPDVHVSVQSTLPAAGATSVCPGASVNATFTVPSGLRMDPNSVTSANFILTGPGPGFTPVVASAVVLDSTTGLIATFTPVAALATGVTYTALVKGGAGGVQDLEIPANTLAADFSWTFTVGPATGQCVQGPLLRSASTYGAFGGSAGMTNQGLHTVINGDIGTTAASTYVTGFHDATRGCSYTETSLNVGVVNGKIYTPPPSSICPTEGTAVTAAAASQARADALAAYNALVAEGGGPDPDPGAGNLASLVLDPGVYTAGSGSFLIRGGDLTLDAHGDANAVWVFQMANTLTVGGPNAAFHQSVLLLHGAQSKNVFWQVGSAATINAGGGGTMEGTIISQAGVSVSTPGNVTLTTVNGRLLSLGASVDLVNTVVNVPAP